VEERVAQLVDGLRRARVKITLQRLEICREIATARHHPDAEQVYLGVRERVPPISLDTVYRTLSLLVELGLIGRLGVPQESMRFDGNLAQHHHFVCSRCGEAFDFSSDDFDQLAVPDGVHALGDVQNIRVEVRGICRRCAQETKS